MELHQRCLSLCPRCAYTSLHRKYCHCHWLRAPTLPEENPISCTVGQKEHKAESSEGDRAPLHRTRLNPTDSSGYAAYVMLNLALYALPLVYQTNGKIDYRVLILHHRTGPCLNYLEQQSSSYISK